MEVWKAWGGFGSRFGLRVIPGVSKGFRGFGVWGLNPKP